MEVRNLVKPLCAIGQIVLGSSALSEDPLRSRWACSKINSGSERTLLFLHSTVNVLETEIVSSLLTVRPGPKPLRATTGYGNIRLKR